MTDAREVVRALAKQYPDDRFVFPVHLNPLVRDVVYPILGGLENIALIEPLPYSEFVNLLARSYLIITDSGGVREEGPSPGKPVLMLRNVTERPEAVKYGTAKLVGLDPSKPTSTACKLPDDTKAYHRMASATNPFGDGYASRRTVQALERFLGFRRDTSREFFTRIDRLEHEADPMTFFPDGGSRSSHSWLPAERCTRPLTTFASQTARFTHIGAVPWRNWKWAMIQS